MPFELEETPLNGAYIIVARRFYDSRGFFSELFRVDSLKRLGIAFSPVQINHSYSRYGVLRGLHFQKKPYEQAKIVYCLRGKIFDVIVDLRRDSDTFGMWYGVWLSEHSERAIYVPRGFAHGFQVVSAEADVVYAVDNIYSPGHEAGIRWDDPDLKISWPIPNPILSEKDRTWPYFREIFPP